MRRVTVREELDTHQNVLVARCRRECATRARIQPALGELRQNATLLEQKGNGQVPVCTAFVAV